MKRNALSLVLLLLSSLAIANEEGASLALGSDVFMTGKEVSHEASQTDDLFMAGETIQSSANITGSAHFAGRRIRLKGNVGQDIYAVGMDLLLSESISGDATLAGYEIVLDGELGGALRAAGSKITVNGPVSGYVLIAGETVNLNSQLAGDVRLATETVKFGDDAQIDGQLVVYEENPGELVIPEYVIPEDRIQRRDIDELNTPGADDMPAVFSWKRVILGFFSGVLVVMMVAVLFAALMPQHLATMRRRILGAPFSTFLSGFIAQSAVIGSAVVFAMTVIGLLFTPASILVAVLIALAGYVIGAYAVGVGVLSLTGKDEPATLVDRTLAAGAGALIVALAGLIPFLGWLFVLAVVLTGIGAIVTLLFRPALFTEVTDTNARLA